MQTDPSLPKTPSRVSASDDSAFSQEEPPFSIPPDLSLDEWLVEHLETLPAETRKVGEELLAAYDAEPEAGEEPTP